MGNRKRLVSFFIVCAMLFIYSISVSAAEKGSIEIVLTDGDIGTSKENVTFEYAKVADVVDGQYQLLGDYGVVDLNSIKYSAELDEAAQKINENVKVEGKVVTDQEGRAVLKELEVGVYLLRVSDRARYENIIPMLVEIPMWNEEQGNMDFDVKVTPKHSLIIPDNPDEGVKTGDTSLPVMYAMLTAGSACIIFIICCELMSCHNRFNCDTMTDKYSKNGGHNNGNDNDTENPRCTRRIGLSSPGSID